MQPLDGAGAWWNTSHPSAAPSQGLLSATGILPGEVRSREARGIPGKLPAEGKEEFPCADIKLKSRNDRIAPVWEESALNTPKAADKGSKNPTSLHLIPLFHVTAQGGILLGSCCRSCTLMVTSGCARPPPCVPHLSHHLNHNVSLLGGRCQAQGLSLGCFGSL